MTRTPRTAAEWRAYGEQMARAKAAHRRRMHPRPTKVNWMAVAMGDSWVVMGGFLGALFQRRRRK